MVGWEHKLKPHNKPLQRTEAAEFCVILPNMKYKLPIFSLVLGGAIWLISIVSIAYFNMHYSVETYDPRSIFKPGAFESLLIILFGAAITCIGLLVGIFALRLSGNKRLSWAAIIINGLYCIPIAALLIMQILRKQ